jgi:hypothetical protein
MCIALAKHGIGYTIIRWIRTILEGRLATQTLGEFSRSVEVSRGCPQGGVLLLFLWCLVVEELITSSIGVEFILKDTRMTCLLAVGKFPNTIPGLIQWALHTVEMCCDELGLLVNPDKIGLVAFKRRKLTGFFDPRLFGATLRRSMSVKYLGVILD